MALFFLFCFPLILKTNLQLLIVCDSESEQGVLRDPESLLDFNIQSSDSLACSLVTLVSPARDDINDVNLSDNVERRGYPYILSFFLFSSVLFPPPLPLFNGKTR